MADQNKVLIRLVYGADHSLSLDSQEYELAEEIRRDERDACAKIAAETVCDVHLPTGTKIYGSRVATAIRARGTS
jgi:hypothetical protein